MVSVNLQSKDHRDLLDIIDRLRAKGLSRDIALPEIIVCGDQSAGKSSVLEAISGISFPTKSTLCTQFATELVLRRYATAGVKVSITPGPDRSAQEKKRLAQFNYDVDIKHPDLRLAIEAARVAMGLSESDFATDTLRVELSGPNQPHLTLVDLPGLYRASDKDQTAGGAAIVKKMVRGYMKRPRSIILAVVSAKSEFVLQDVTELAREVDPRGLRTLGLITKPDLLERGSESESSYVEMARNENVVLKLGWHVLKNRNFEMRDASSSERDRAEEKYLSEGLWASVDPACLGIHALRPRLSEVLKQQILRQLPSLVEDVEARILDCQHHLARLGASRGSLAEQRRYLHHIGEQFSMLIRASLDGSYNDPFFGSAEQEDGYQKRVRAVVQNRLAQFAEDMRLHGENRVILEEPNKSALQKGQICRSDYLEHVKDLMRRNRGTELPGTFNPLLVGQLFAEQCKPWKMIALAVKDSILETVHRAIETILEHLVVDEIADNLIRLVCGTLHRVEKELDDKVHELLEPHSSFHPITYNHYLTDNVQKAQARRIQRQFEQIFTNHFDDKIDARTILAAFTKRIEVDPERSGCESAIDYMQAYYKVAIKRFIDDIGVLAIEACLLRKLPSLFDAATVYDLTDDDVRSLAAESEETTRTRAQYQEKLNVLEEGLHDLKRLNQHHSTREPGSEGVSSETSEVNGKFVSGTSSESEPVDEMPAEDEVQF
ncbi:uncharacterized protein E0L32_002505 [Thyridium curvatum]|uniref:Uncharacterized protein n=1 Tax=Thyridium curvatum TaxID=1093900 RepID=A0A507BPC2_9PEZI|nr:uncharacterized protein E0L32_002505 [Thyridium curvatum]TPX18648.1 hypothetical protein E0L32_002505 [Thyridium curvatum]